MGSDMYTVLVCILGILATTLGGARYTRDTGGCNQEELLVEVEQCASMAHTTYREAWAKGDDGTKADFYARKSCNYITETIEDCSDILKHCMDEEQLNSYKDEQYKNALENVEANIETWDSSKCPAVQRHKDRLIAAEAEKGTEDENTPAADENAEENKDAEKAKSQLQVLHLLLFPSFPPLSLLCLSNFLFCFYILLLSRSGTNHSTMIVTNNPQK